VSGLDTPWDDDEEEPCVSGQSQRRQTSCPGHERALPHDEFVRLLDMKEEGERLPARSVQLKAFSKGILNGYVLNRLGYYYISCVFKWLSYFFISVFFKISLFYIIVLLYFGYVHCLIIFYIILLLSASFHDYHYSMIY